MSINIFCYKHQPTMTSLQHFGNALNMRPCIDPTGDGVEWEFVCFRREMGLELHTSLCSMPLARGRSFGQTTITLNLRLGSVASVVWNLDPMCNATCGIRTACSTQGCRWNVLETYSVRFKILCFT